MPQDDLTGGDAPWGPTTSGRPTISYLTQALLQRLGQTSPGNAPATQPTIQMDLGQGPVAISTIGPQGQQLSPSEALLRYKEANALVPQGTVEGIPRLASAMVNPLGLAPPTHVLVPVDHDPFATSVTPVDHDPFEPAEGAPE